MGPKTGCERLAGDRIRSQADDNNYAVAFLVLVDRPGLTDRCPSKTDCALSGCAVWRSVYLSSDLNSLTYQAL